MEIEYSSKTLTTMYRTTRTQMPQKCNFHTHRYNTSKPHAVKKKWRKIRKQAVKS